MSPGAARRALAQPKVLLSLLLMTALLFFAFSLGHVDAVLERLQALSIGSLAVSLALAAAYLVLKGRQLRRLLGRLHAGMTWRRFALAFAVGELAATLPLGIFAQNWVLSQQRSMPFGHSASATALMLLMELVIALAWLALFPVLGWDWLRPVAVLLLVGLFAMLFGLLRFEPLALRFADRVKYAWLRRTLDEAIGLIHGLGSLCRWRVLAVNFVLSSAYLGTLLLAFLNVGHAIGLGALDYLQASSIYAFALAVILMGGGVVGQIGSMEVLGMNAAKAYGFDYTDGLALMLGFRLVWIASIWLIGAPIVLRLRHLLQPEGLAAGNAPLPEGASAPSAERREKAPD